MNDKEKQNSLISAIAETESRLAKLDKERYKILAELKSLKAELLILTNSSLDSTKDTPISIDFDKESWTDDVTAFMETCRNLKIPAALERSRSGKGAHVWIFFSTPVLASKARKLGCYLLTETMSRHHQLGMNSYDRLFPNQDTMPKGGFGNLIALPLQKEAGKQGNTLFLDQHLQPYDDQWAFLSSIPRMPPQDIEEIVNEAERNGQIKSVQ